MPYSLAAGTNSFCIHRPRGMTLPSVMLYKPHFQPRRPVKPGATVTSSPQIPTCQSLRRYHVGYHNRRIRNNDQFHKETWSVVLHGLAIFRGEKGEIARHLGANLLRRTAHARLGISRAEPKIVSRVEDAIRVSHRRFHPESHGLAPIFCAHERSSAHCPFIMIRTAEPQVRPHPRFGSASSAFRASPRRGSLYVTSDRLGFLCRMNIIT